MKVILMRHGQTAENVARRHQPTSTVLSAAGKAQVQAAAASLRAAAPNFTVTHIVSSPLNRTLQTASVLATELELIPSIDHDLRELERPRSLTGHRHTSPRSLLFYKFWFFGLTKEGESYAAIRARIVAARAHLERLPEDVVVVVVSHTVFINLFLAHLYNSKPLWPWQAAATFVRLLKMRNASMIELTFDKHASPKWQRTNNLHLP